MKAWKTRLVARFRRNCARRGTVAAMTSPVDPTTKARRLIMSATLTRTCDRTESPMSRDQVKKMLHDAAFVLHLTRRVKAEIVAERPDPARIPNHPRRPEMSAGLGV